MKIKSISDKISLVAKKTKKLKRGYFLIQILLVMAIMAILATTAYIYVAPQINKAKDAKAKEDLIQIRNALTQYYDDTGCFPQSLPSCGQDFQLNSVTYYKNFPCSSNGTPYEYETDNTICPKWYKVLTNLLNKNDPSITSVECRNGCGQKCNYNYGLSSNIAINQGCPQTPQNYYACTPSGQCAIYANPGQSKCPVTFLNDPTCQNQCSVKANRCHDESGKMN